MRKVAIVGSHPATKHYAPFNDPEYDIWVFNEAANIEWCKRANGVFQMHDPSVYRSEFNRTDKKHWEWLQQEHDDMRIWMQEIDPDVPNSMEYPWKNVVKKLLPGFKWANGQQIEYGTSTVAYSIALAVWLEYDQIDLYGIDMESNTEYIYQRDCVAFWTGLALGRGIKVVQHSGAGLYDVPLYGYDGQIYFTPTEIEEEGDYLRDEQAKALAHLEDIQTQEKAAELWGDEYVVLHGQLIDATAKHGKTCGTVLEMEFYMGHNPDGVERQQFEQRSAAARDKKGKYLSYMNYESGKAQAFMACGDTDKYHEATKMQLEYAFNAGVEEGIHFYNRQHMIAMEQRIRAAGGQKAIAAIEG